MYQINTDNNELIKINPRGFKELGFKERENLQEWIAKTPSALGEELLIIQKEFDGFDDTRERLDLLALDKKGNLIPDSKVFEHSSTEFRNCVVKASGEGLLIQDILRVKNSWLKLLEKYLLKMNS